MSTCIAVIMSALSASCVAVSLFLLSGALFILFNGAELSLVFRLVILGIAAAFVGVGFGIAASSAVEAKHKRK